MDTYGLRSADARKVPGRDKSFAEGDSAILYATYPEETRTIWLRHRSSGLAKLFQFTAKAEEKERTIILEPPAVATGRVVTSEGTPLSEIEVQCDVGGDSNKSFPPALTDAQGHFRRDLPAGGPITVSFAGVRLPELTVVGGEQIDFGEIAIERDAKQPWKSTVHRGPAKRAKGATAEPASSAASSPLAGAFQGDPKKPATPVPTTRELHGRVLLPNGQPAAGATVRAMTAIGGWPSNPRFESKLLGVFSTNAEGRFAGSIDAPSRPGPAGATPSTGGRKWPVDGVDVDLWATLPGYGLALVPLESLEQNQPIVIKLADEQPIRGHLLDLEGRPIRDAKVQGLDYTETNSSAVDQFVAKALETKPDFHQDSLFPQNREMAIAPALVLPPVKTDADGHFELRGVGRDRMLELRILAPKIAATMVTVLTRPIKPVDLRFRKLFGSQFECVTPPSVPVEGFVIDEDSGKPIPGCRFVNSR